MIPHTRSFRSRSPITTATISVVAALMMLNATGAVANTASATAPPNTKITRSLSRHSGSKWSFVFRFVATEGEASGFECALTGTHRKDGRAPTPAFSPCSAPKIYRHVKGRYRFSVRAFNSSGVDPTSAVVAIGTTEF